MRVLFCIILLLAVVGIPVHSEAQDFKRRYAEAKSYFEDGRYEKSLDAFRELMVYDKANPYAEYAGFYFALSAWHQNMKALARTTLLRLKSLYPGWSNADEINYWLALLYFDEGDPFRAMKELSKIAPSSSVTGLKNQYLKNLNDPEVLRMLVEDTRDTVAARQLVQVLVAQRSAENLKEARSLMGRYGIPEDDLLPKSGPLSETGERRISVLFPFLTKTIKSSPGIKRNQYALDLYQGLKLAADQQRKAGIRIEIAAYDTERNPATTGTLLKLPELVSSDVVVGPLFAEEYPLVREWAARNRVTTLHPATSNADFLENNPTGLLFQPTYRTMGRKGADYAASLNIPGACFIFYENTPKDSLMAFAFRERAIEIGLRVKEFRRVTKASAGVITTILGSPRAPGPVSKRLDKISKDSIGFVFMASDSEVIYSKAINSVNAKSDVARLLGLESWLEKSTADLMRMEDLKLAFLSPNFYDPLTPEYRAFHKAYTVSHGAPPSTYARIGFELGHFLGRRWMANSESLSPLTDGGFDRGLIGGGIDFGGMRDNQVVPISGFSEGRLIRFY